jgi:hypothetical protein
MPRTALTVVSSALNAKTAAGAGVAVDPTNDHVLSLKGRKGRRVLIEIDHTTATPKTFTVKAGAYGPSIRGKLGDLVISLSATTRTLIQLETSRFTQANGDVNIDLEAAMTGTIWVFAMAPGA